MPDMPVNGAAATEQPGDATVLPPHAVPLGRSYFDRVLDFLDRIPPGRVATYGLIAEYLEAGGPRQVAKVLAGSGGEVAWWRVVRADGTLPPELAARARPEYLIERTPLRASGAVDVKAALWVPQEASGQDQTGDWPLKSRP